MAGKIEYRDNSKEVIGAFHKALHRGLTAVGMKAETYAKKACPKDTGRLRNSITYAIAGYEAHVKSYRRDNVSGGATQKRAKHQYSGAADGQKDEAVYIGTNVEYAPYVENGTSRQKARPFLKPAATEHNSEYKSLMENSMKNA